MGPEELSDWLTERFETHIERGLLIVVWIASILVGFYFGGLGGVIAGAFGGLLVAGVVSFLVKVLLFFGPTFAAAFLSILLVGSIFWLISATWGVGN